MQSEIYRFNGTASAWAKSGILTEEKFIILRKMSCLILKNAKNARSSRIATPMNNRLSLGISLLLGITAPGLWSGPLHAADAPRTPRALNVARADLGAKLTAELPPGVSTDGVPRIAQALLSPDDPLGCELPAGTTTLVVALPRTETLRQMDFLNLTAAGQVSVAASNVRLPADSPRWRSVVGAQEFANVNDVVACELGAVEARHVRLTFNLPKAGRIDTLGLFGNTTTAGAAEVPAIGGRAFVGVSQVDSGNVSSQARITEVSSGGGPADADRMIDGNLRTSFTFGVSDRRPTAVIDLGANRTLTRASLAYRAGPGQLEFYLKPDPNANTAIVRRNPSYSGITAQVPQVSSVEVPADGNGKPIATIQSDGSPGLRRATVGLDGQTGRYLVVVFTPSGGGSTPPQTRDYKDARDYKDFKDVRDFKDMPPAGTGSSEPLSISEVTAFGPPGAPITAIPQLPPPDRTIITPPPAGDGLFTE